MSSALRGDDGFLLYMFEEDSNMIEKWATEYREQNNGDIPCYGDMYGLWTNSRNPVVHVVLKGNKNPTDDYLCLQSPQFSYIGCWSFEKPTERIYQHMMDKTSTMPPRVVFLEVKYKMKPLVFHPILFTEGQKIEPLKGKNPFRLPDQPGNSIPEKENVEEEKKEGIVAKIGRVVRDEACKIERRVIHFMEGSNSQESVSYASAVKHGHQDNTLKTSDQRQDDLETTPASNTPLSFQDVQDASTCTKGNQWYSTAKGQKMLHEISSKLKELVNEDPKISRDNDTHNAMILFSFEEKNYVILFPPNFPSEIPVELYRQTTSSSTTGRANDSSVTRLKSRDPLQLVEKIFAAL